MYNPNMPGGGLGLYPASSLGYQPYQQTAVAPQQSIQIPQVSGEAGARAYQIPANSSILLLDSTDNVIWCKTTDAGGFATLTGYRISPLETKPAGPVQDTSEFVTKKDFNDLKDRFEKLMEELGDGKSNS